MFGAGFSNGGYMVSKAAHLFDGISPWGGHQTHLNATRPTPITMHHGLKDGVVKVTGCCSGAKCCCGIDASSDECVHFFGVYERLLRVNRCASYNVVESTHATCRVGVGCRANTTACLHTTMSHTFNDLARPASNDMRGPSVVDVLEDNPWLMIPMVLPMIGLTFAMVSMGGGSDGGEEKTEKTKVNQIPC